MALHPTPLFTVARALPVPGLGLLLLPAGPAPHLRPLALHTALAVTLHLPDGRTYPATATVEEVAAETTPQPALLLADWPNPVPAGTAVWQRPDAAPDAYASLT